MAAFLKRSLTTTVYPDVQRAMQDPQHVPHSDDIVPTLAVVRCNFCLYHRSQIPSTSGQPRAQPSQRCYIGPVENTLFETARPARYSYSVHQPRRAPASLVHSS
ncbi:hypothetical protein BDZ89DRAFT_152551 [Hymenopellis radicata]|nr:hypothetical protein BDZ89DRAFT_152551 [Hymenopellis radicata]